MDVRERQHRHNDLLFIVSVDTEEEWHWDDDFPVEQPSVENLEILPKFQRFCEQRGIFPSYFVDYPVAADSRFEAIFSGLDPSQSEIGAHLHPWCTPPFINDNTEFNSHCLNLPIEQFEAKLDVLLAELAKKVQQPITSFRSGRWGATGAMLKALAKRGIQVDSSLYPWYRNSYFDNTQVPMQPFYPCYLNAHTSGAQRELLEIPITAGFTQGNHAYRERFHRRVEGSLCGKFKLIGLLDALQLHNKVYLSPELHGKEQMLKLARQVAFEGASIIHLYFHSSTLIEGATGLVNTDDAYALITESIDYVYQGLSQSYQLVPSTVTQARTHLSNWGQIA